MVFSVVAAVAIVVAATIIATRLLGRLGRRRTAHAAEDCALLEVVWTFVPVLLLIALTTLSIAAWPRSRKWPAVLSLTRDIVEARVRLYDVGGQTPQIVDTVRDVAYVSTGWPKLSRAPYYANPHPLASGFFRATLRIPRAGRWGLEFVVQQRGHDLLAQRIFPNALSESPTPAVGGRVPSARILTLHDVGGDLSRLDSDLRVGDPEMHRTSIAQALSERRPAVVLFASPGLDETRLSLPVLEIVRSLYPDYGQQVAFVHVEVYDLAHYRRGLLDGGGSSSPPQAVLSNAAERWGIQNSPWLFLIDGRGRLVAKFFGPVARSEVEEALRRLVKGDRG